MPTRKALIQCAKDCPGFLDEESLEDRSILVWSCSTCGAKHLWIHKKYTDYKGKMITLLRGSKHDEPDVEAP